MRERVAWSDDAVMRKLGSRSMRLVLGVVVLGAAALAAVGPAMARSSAETASPGAAAVLEVRGEVEGSTEVGGRLSMRVDATMAGGWRAIHVAEFRILEGGRELDRVALDVDNNRLIVLGRYVLVGTEAVAVGAYVRVPASQVVITTGGEHLSVVVTAEVLRAIPDTASFRLSATDDTGVTESVVRSLSAPGPEGIGWGTVLAVVVAAVFAGAFAGNLIASRRRPPPRLSVYGSIQRRIDDERSSAAGPR